MLVKVKELSVKECDSVSWDRHVWGTYWNENFEPLDSHRFISPEKVVSCLMSLIRRFTPILPPELFSFVPLTEKIKSPFSTKLAVTFLEGDVRQDYNDVPQDPLKVVCCSITRLKAKQYPRGKIERLGHKEALLKWLMSLLVHLSGCLENIFGKRF